MERMMFNKKLSILFWIVLLGTSACSGPNSESKPPSGMPIPEPIIVPVNPSPSSTPPSVANTPTPATQITVVYVEKWSVWLKEEFSEPRRLTSSAIVRYVYLSDDGKKIAYVSYSNASTTASIGAINSDGSGNHIALSAQTIAALFPYQGPDTYTTVDKIKFIPGTHTILFNTKHVRGAFGAFRNDDLFRLDLDTDSFSTLFVAGSGGDPYPSPDGSRLAVSSKRSISLVNMDGSHPHPNLITFPQIQPPISYGNTENVFEYAPPIVWRPDSRLMGVLIPSPDQTIPSPTAAVYRIDPASGSIVSKDTLNGKFLFYPASISPDLIHVGYMPWESDTTPNETAYVYDLDHKTRAPFPVGSFLWSKNGDRYLAGNMIISVDGSQTQCENGCNHRFIIWVSNSRFVWLDSDTLGSWFIGIGTSEGKSFELVRGDEYPGVWDMDAVEGV